LESVVPTEVSAPTRPVAVERDDPSVDPIVELATRAVDANMGWIAPRELFTERGGAPIYPAAVTPPQSVQILERHRGEVRIGVRMANARVALWADSSSLYGVIRDDTSVDDAGHTGAFASADDPEVRLHMGARVTVLGREDHRVHVRYTGQLEVDGWVPSVMVSDRMPGHERIPHMNTSFGHVIAVNPGAAIRVEPQWSARILAVMVGGLGSFLTVERNLPDDEYVVSYVDNDVAVRGYVSLREAPSPIRGELGQRPPPPQPPTPATATVAAGTCLYARERGEPIGFITESAAVDLEPASGSWFTITLDTPWGPMAFAAQGTSATSMVACGSH
jgi:hypothetical protein